MAIPICQATLKAEGNGKELSMSEHADGQMASGMEISESEESRSGGIL